MEIISDISTALAAVGSRLVDFIPNIIAAIIIFVVGLFFADALGRLVARLLNQLYLDSALEHLGLRRALERIGFKLTVSKAIKG